MRCMTLKASSDRPGGLLAYYAGRVEDRTRPTGPARGPVDYYLDPGEPAGRWCTLDPGEQLAAMITRAFDHESALARRAQLRRAAGLEPPELDGEPARTMPSLPGPIEPPTNPARTDPNVDDRVRAMQGRLDHLQQRSAGSLSRTVKRLERRLPRIDAMNGGARWPSGPSLI